MTGEKTAKQAADELAEYLDEKLDFLSKHKKLICGPMLGKSKPEAEWLRTDGTSPKAKLANEKPKGQTVEPRSAWKGYENE